MAMKSLYLTIGYLILNYKFFTENGDTNFEIIRKSGVTVSVENDIPVIVKKRV